MKYSVVWAIRHFAFSCIIALFLALLIFLIWYPSSLIFISGGIRLFFLMIFIDVICGPLLTLILVNEKKTRRALYVDITLIFTVQLCALGYGLYSLSLGRPLALVFEKDRFHVISYSDIYVSNEKRLPRWVTPFGFDKPRLLGIRGAENLDEKIASVEASLQGVEPGQLPEWWQDYGLSIEEMRSRAKKMDVLLEMHPEDVDRIRSAIRKIYKKQSKDIENMNNQLHWLPVVSRHSMEWVAFIDIKTGEIVGYLDVDGFVL